MSSAEAAAPRGCGIKQREVADLPQRLSRLTVVRLQLPQQATSAVVDIQVHFRGFQPGQWWGQRAIDFPAGLLRRSDRDPHTDVAPPHGLTLEEVRYPPDADLAAAAERARRFRGV